MEKVTETQETAKKTNEQKQEFVIVELTPKNAKYLARLAELKDDKRSTDSLVNEALSYDIARQAKAQSRLILGTMGQKIQSFKKLGASSETIESVQNVIIRNAESFDALAAEVTI